MRTLSLPALPLKLFLNQKDELLKAKSGPSRGEKWKAEFDEVASTLGKDFRFGQFGFRFLACTAGEGFSKTNILLFGLMLALKPRVLSTCPGLWV